MIRFDNLWKTMKKKKVSTYELIYKHGFSRGQLDRIRKNGNVNSNTIATLCKILNCKVQDIFQYYPDEENNKKEKE